MRIPAIRTTINGADTLTLALDGQLYTLDSSIPRFEEIAQLADTDVQDEDLPTREAELLELIEFAKRALSTLRSLSERVSVRGDTIYFDGDVIDNVLTKHIVAMIRNGDDTWQAPVSFLEKLMSNPAKHVRKRLFQWISDRGLTLTEEGDVIGYKGVQAGEENLSVHAGRNTVYVNGEPHNGHIPNPVGATLTMPRSEVNNDRDAGCEQGLHVGTFDYARNWGHGNTLTVQFSPRDVVAIPSDSDFSKIRVCRYTVLSRDTDEAYQGTTYLPADDANDDADAPFLQEDDDFDY